MVLSFIFILARACVLGASFLVFIAHPLETEESSVFKKIMDQNQPAIEIIDQEWPDEDSYAYLMRCMKYQCELDEQKKRSVVLKILEKSALKKVFTANNICDDVTSWQDLNLFCGQKNLAVYLASIIDRTHTAFGQATLYAMLVNPAQSTAEIERRQGIIRYLLENPGLLETLDKQLKDLKESESMVLSFWCDDPLRQEVKRERYLQWPLKTLNDYVNKSEMGLAILNTWGHIERMLYLRDYILGAFFVTGYNSLALAHVQSPEYVQEMSSWLQHERGITPGPILNECLPRIENATGKNILGLLAGLYALMNINDWAAWTRDQFYLDSCLHMKIMHVASYFQSIKELNHTVRSSMQWSQNFLLAPFLDNACEQYHENNADVRQLLTLFSHPSFKEKPSYPTHKGRSLLGFKLMNEQKDLFHDVFASIGEIDAYVSIAKLVKEKQTQRTAYCFVECVDTDRPMIDILDFWNPFIEEKKIVFNSIALGQGGRSTNIIVTGPNAGGKSTVLKALAIDVLMGQSFGIAPAKAMKFTPFSKITTYMNIRDDIAAGNSLFKAQVLRAQELFECAQSMKEKKFCFAIIDEMFNGTSPLEAEACAYSVARNLGSRTNTMCLIATHFPLLTTLEHDTHTFENYSVQVQKSSDGTIIYPFKLKRGISQQHIALDILKAQGFDGSILNDAHAIINNA
jgi:DNA mismatch repair ATPase MutS